MEHGRIEPFQPNTAFRRPNVRRDKRSSFRHDEIMGHWPAAGFVDTEIRCLTELESWNAEKEVQPRVQA
jgi:hypothetical protein